jgi:mono/diheme cytochrome c family protein
MQGHFSRAASAHDALIRADMEQARADMAWLATHEEPSLPAELQPLLDNMQAEAARFPEATTLTEAGTTFARMLVRCGECHTTSHGGPEIAQTPIPEGDTPEARMRRHQWASDRMFDGLVMADPEIFRSGNDALTSAPLTQADLPGTEAQPAEQVATLTTHVRELGAEAATAADEQARAGIYGRYLATCGACHRLLEGGAPAALQPAPGGTAPAPAPAPSAPQ